MIDYLKIAIDTPGYKDQLYNNSLLNFTTIVNDRTGEIQSQMHTAEYKGLKFLLFNSGRVEIKGSLHKYFNNGLHNHNDFSINEINTAINSLIDQFQIDPHKAIIHGLEIGLNISPPFGPNSFINQLSNYKGRLFDSMDIKGSGRGKKCRLTQYLIKIYNKGLQYNLKYHVLRVEVKFNKMESLRKTVITLDELRTSDFLLFSCERLMLIYDRIIINENLKNSLLNNTEKKSYNELKHPDVWESFDRRKYSYYKGVYDKIINKHIKNPQKKIVADLLKSKAMYLNKSQPQSWDNLTGLPGEILGQSDQVIQIAILGQSDHLVITSNSLKEARVCLTCNGDISSQPINSKYCTDQRKCRDYESNRKKKKRKDEGAGLLWSFDAITKRR